MTLAFIQDHNCMQKQTFCTHFLVNVSVDLDKIQCATTLCCEGAHTILDNREGFYLIELNKISPNIDFYLDLYEPMCLTFDIKT